MQRIESNSVIWVGPKGGAVFHHLASNQRRRGQTLSVCEKVNQLPEALGRATRPVVVVRDGGETNAEAILTALSSVYRSVPVVVLVEQAAFGRYYDLMGRGARFYYELSESPETIGRAVQYTAARAA